MALAEVDQEGLQTCQSPHSNMFSKSVGTLRLEKFV